MQVFSMIKVAPEEVFYRFPTIEVNNDYILRQMTYDDAPDYLEYMSHDEVNKYVPEECLPRDLDQARNEIKYNLDLFEYRRSLFWALAEKSTNKLVGSCGFNYWNRDHARTEISYDLARDLWGKGVMTQVVHKIVTFGFTHMQLHRVEATATPTNAGSLKVLRKVGFKKEGLLREQKLLHGKFHDAVILSLLKQDYLKF